MTEIDATEIEKIERLAAYGDILPDTAMTAVLLVRTGYTEMAYEAFSHLVTFGVISIDEMKAAHKALEDTFGDGAATHVNEIVETTTADSEYRTFAAVVDCDIKIPPPRFFSGDDSRPMWRGINTARTADDLQTAVYYLALQVQRLEESLHAETAVCDVDDFKLSSCPFCGSDAEVIKKFDDLEIVSEYDIGCTSDDCFVESGADHYFKTQEDAAASWNTRVISIPSNEEIEGEATQGGGDELYLCNAKDIRLATAVGEITGLVSLGKISAADGITALLLVEVGTCKTAERALAIVRGEVDKRPFTPDLIPAEAILKVIAGQEERLFARGGFTNPESAAGKIDYNAKAGVRYGRELYECYLAQEERPLVTLNNLKQPKHAHKMIVICKICLSPHIVCPKCLSTYHDDGTAIEQKCPNCDDGGEPINPSSGWMCKVCSRSNSFSNNKQVQNWYDDMLSKERPFRHLVSLDCDTCKQHTSVTVGLTEKFLELLSLLVANDDLSAKNAAEITILLYS